MKELSPPALNLRRLLPETTASEPVLIIISPGADPSQELLDLVRNTVGPTNYHEVCGCVSVDVGSVGAKSRQRVVEGSQERAGAKQNL